MRILLITLLFLSSCTYKFIGPDETSMLPTIRGGDIVHVDERFNFENLKIGDIVIFYPEGEDFAPVHRIVAETNGG